jgi:hypothetical protein
MLGIGPRSLCRNWFNTPNILMVPSLHTFSLIIFVVNNSHNVQANSSIHCTNTKHKCQLHVTLVKYSSMQHGVTYSSIKIFNSLPASILKLQKDKLIFKSTLRKYFVMHTFQPTKEFL